MLFDLNIPWDLTRALGPDLFLMVGAMVLTLVAAWGDETPARQRMVGWGSIIVVLLTIAAVAWYWVAGNTATAGVVAVDDFRWTADIVLLVGTLLALLFSIDYNDRVGITA